MDCRYDPYFITEQGGITSKDKLFVNELSCAEDYKSWFTIKATFWIYQGRIF